MNKRCIPGVICIENITIVFVIIVLFVILLFFHYRNNSIGVGNNDKMRYSIMKGRERQMPPPQMIMPDMPIYSEDVLLNPYDAPLRDNRYSQDLGRFIPLNFQRPPIDINYRQVGILTRKHGKETILPLMGRPLFTNRDKWNFYTMNDSNNVVKLPITFKGRSCTSEYGCDNLYSGDIVYVEGYNDAFKVTVYDNQVSRYNPFI